MELNEQSSASEQELQPLEFSEPVCRCEIKAHYTNPQGQEFEFSVRGTNADAVRDYMKAAKVSFEVLPVREGAPEEEEPTEEVDEREQRLIEEELKKLELHPELDLEISIDVVNTQGIDLPYDLNVVIDPPIAGGATHNYVTQTNTRRIRITLNASKEGGVVGSLNGGTPQQADTFPPNPPASSTRFSGGSPTSNPSRFSFSVTGLGTNNKYTKSSTTRLIQV